MPWFANHYSCARCGRRWIDEWSAMCDDDCPHCGARHMSPDDSDDLSVVVEKRGRHFFVRRSAATAEHHAEYRDVAEFSTPQLAAVYRDFLLAQRQP